MTPHLELLSWEEAQPHWDGWKAALEAPNHYALQPWWFDFFHRLSDRMEVRVLRLEQDGRFLGALPYVEIRRRGGIREHHAFPWGAPGGVYLVPWVSPELRRQVWERTLRPRFLRAWHVSLWDVQGTLSPRWKGSMAIRETVRYRVAPTLITREQLSRGIRRTLDSLDRLEIQVRSLNHEELDHAVALHLLDSAARKRPALPARFFQTFWETLPAAHRLVMGIWEHEELRAVLWGVGTPREGLFWWYAVHPDHRRRGFYHLLIFHALQEARSRNWAWVDLGTHPRGSGLDALKERFGAERMVFYVYHYPRWMDALKGAMNRVWHRRRISL